MIRTILINRFIFSSLFCVAMIVAFAANAVFAQDDATKLDPSMVAETADSAEGFVPDGWMIEEKITGDVNGDGKADMLLKLIEDKPKKPDEFVDRARALVIAVKADGGGWRNAAVATDLLQCTGCGGAFYGAVDAPANVSIERGIIIVSQDHGSREVTETTFRFRFDEQPSMFILIGFDYATRDRANGNAWTESTNYITGKRITTVGKGSRTTTKTTYVAKDRAAIGEVDYSNYEENAAKRLGLD